MKVYNFVTALLGVMVLLEFAGLNADKVGLLGVFGYAIVDGAIQFQPSLSNIFLYIFDNITGILVGLGLGAVAAGLFAKGKLENFIILPVITTTLTLFVTVIGDIVNIGLEGGPIPAWIGYVVVFIGIVMSGGLILSLIEFFRGTD